MFDESDGFFVGIDLLYLPLRFVVAHEKIKSQSVDKNCRFRVRKRPKGFLILKIRSVDMRRAIY